MPWLRHLLLKKRNWKHRPSWIHHFELLKCTVLCKRNASEICRNQRNYANFGNQIANQGGGEVTLLKFLDPLRLPVWRHIVTGKSLGSLVQISERYDSYVDERGRGKAKKLANIAIYRLFDRMCVSFGVAIICLCKPFWYFVSVIV